MPTGIQPLIAEVSADGVKAFNYGDKYKSPTIKTEDGTKLKLIADPKTSTITLKVDGDRIAIDGEAYGLFSTEMIHCGEFMATMAEAQLVEVSLELLEIASPEKMETLREEMLDGAENSLVDVNLLAERLCELLDEVATSNNE